MTNRINFLKQAKKLEKIKGKALFSRGIRDLCDQYLVRGEREMPLHIVKGIYSGTGDPQRLAFFEAVNHVKREYAEDLFLGMREKIVLELESLRDFLNNKGKGKSKSAGRLKKQNQTRSVGLQAVQESIDLIRRVGHPDLMKNVNRITSLIGILGKYAGESRYTNIYKLSINHCIRRVEDFVVWFKKAENKYTTPQQSVFKIGILKKLKQIKSQLGKKPVALGLVSPKGRKHKSRSRASTRRIKRTRRGVARRRTLRKAS